MYPKFDQEMVRGAQRDEALEAFADTGGIIIAGFDPSETSKLYDIARNAWQNPDRPRWAQDLSSLTQGFGYGRGRGDLDRYLYRVIADSNGTGQKWSEQLHGALGSLIHDYDDLLQAFGLVATDMDVNFYGPGTSKYTFAPHTDPTCNLHFPRAGELLWQQRNENPLSAQAVQLAADERFLGNSRYRHWVPNSDQQFSMSATIWAIGPADMLVNAWEITGQ